MTRAPQTDYFVPTSLDEAAAIRRDQPQTVLVAGGTATSLFLRRRRRPVIDLRDCVPQTMECRGGSIRVGGMVTLATLVCWLTEQGSSTAQLVATAASRVGSSFIRNAATFGGSTVACFRWSDLPAALLVVEARMVLRLPTGRDQVVKANEFFSSHPARLFRDGAILTHVEFPHTQTRGWSFLKLSTNKFGHAVWNAAAIWDAARGSSRVALSAGLSLPRRLVRTEAILNDGTPRRDQIMKAAGKDLDELGVVASRTVSRSYRRSTGPVIVADVVDEALRRGGAQE